MNYEFICPKCGKKAAIEELVEQAFITSLVTGITDNYEIQTGPATILDGNIQGYQCSLCGYFICKDRSRLIGVLK